MLPLPVPPTKKRSPGERECENVLLVTLESWEWRGGPKSYSTILKTIVAERAIKMALEAAIDMGEQGALLHTQCIEE